MTERNEVEYKMGKWGGLTTKMGKNMQLKLEEMLLYILCFNSLIMKQNIGSVEKGKLLSFRESNASSQFKYISAHGKNN